jgi:hypothetical protein
VEFRISLTPRLSILLMLFSLIFLVLVSLIGYELGYREGQKFVAPNSLDSKAARSESSELVARPASVSNEQSNKAETQRP